MRAVEGDPPEDAGPWHWEPRLPGVRCLAFISRGRVRLCSSHRIPLNQVLSDIARVLPKLARGNAVLDGVYAGGALHLFDCLHYEGVSLRPLPLTDRKAVLRDAVWLDELVRETPSKPTFAALVSEVSVCHGFIAKRADSAYHSGLSGDWRAVVSAHTHDFVVGGYVQSAGAPTPSALLVGQRSGSHLMYAGRVATTAGTHDLARVAGVLRRLRRRTSPFESAVPHGPNIHWAAPALVARVGFREWSEGGLVRDGRLVGLRAES